MDWKSKYASKICSADDAISHIEDGFKLFLTGNCSVPQKLLQALISRAPKLKNVEIYHALTVAGSDYVAPEMEGHLRVVSLFISPNVRKAIQEGRADFTPVLLSEFPLLFKKRIIPLDVAFVHLSPPDKDGYCTYGVETGLTKSAAESARFIIAEINEQMPTLLGDTKIHLDEITYIVPVDYPMAELRMGAESDDGIVEQIGVHIADRIPDGATLQLGIGGIPDAVLKHLKNKKNLGIHSELFSDGVIDLVEAGVINGAAKTIHKGKITAGFIIGTHRLYQWVNHNPLVELYRTEYINSPFVISQNAKMVALNSAIEVDLTGQVCADSIGPKFFSGVGGQLDFIYGSSMSEGGLPIIALPSSCTLRDGSVVSRITPLLKQGAGVVTTRNHVHYVVTEYGMVDLYGKSVRERSELLISIAHPQFRDELRFQAKELHFL
jgi:acetyl-CoA hydrolase